MADHATIVKNLARVDKLVDDDVEYSPSGVPLFRWLEISPIDVCNRKCVFCPKSDESVAPDQPSAVMKPVLFEKMANELQELRYDGTVMLAGYGEPILSRHIYDMVGAFSKVCNTEITTNGDPLTPKKIAGLLEAGAHKLVVSLYDGPEQVEKMHDLFKQAGATEENEQNRQYKP
jgi:molybdenum cofactor biosynthesis enzyme MoaA